MPRASPKGPARQRHRRARAWPGPGRTARTEGHLSHRKEQTGVIQVSVGSQMAGGPAVVSCPAWQGQAEDGCPPPRWQKAPEPPCAADVQTRTGNPAEQTRPGGRGCVLNAHVLFLLPRFLFHDSHTRPAASAAEQSVGSSFTVGAREAWRQGQPRACRPVPGRARPRQGCQQGHEARTASPHHRPPLLGSHQRSLKGPLAIRAETEQAPPAYQQVYMTIKLHLYKNRFFSPFPLLRHFLASSLFIHLWSGSSRPG